MKTLHVIPSIHPRYGGPSKAIIEMCEALSKVGVECDIATTHFSGETKILARETRVYSFKASSGEYKFSLGLYLWLKKNIKNYDLVHIHSVFCFPTFIAARIASQNKVPYILRTIGQLYPWVLANRSSFFKKIYLGLIEKKTIDMARFLHFTTEDEKNSIGVKINNKKNFVLPLGVNIPKKIHKTKFEEFFPELKNKKILLFLSRIHPKKGLELLLNSFDKKTDLTLVVAGSGNEEYVSKIKRIAQKLNIKNQVKFTGHISGKRKLALLQNSVAFILPSYTENFGISVVEAMASGVPILISKNVGLSDDIEKNEAGITFNLDINSIRKSIEKIKNNGKILKMKKNGLKLVQEKYNWKKIAREQVKIYERIINK